MKQQLFKHFYRSCAILCAVLFSFSLASQAERQQETLDRGVVALPNGDGGVFISWRLLATDASGLAFDIYRQAGTAEAVKLNDTPLTGATCFVDTSVKAGTEYTYSVRSQNEVAVTGVYTLAANTQNPFISIPLQTPSGFTPNDASVGDLDGDGDYEIVLHLTGSSRDNSQSGQTDAPIIDAYTLEGEQLWRINLGRNIREGAHYTQFMVYDLNGDGRAELACKTADGTVDGAGQVIGDAEADYRNPQGYVLEGPEFLTIFDGKTGRALETVPYNPPRGNVASWGDDYGNRVDRFLACIAYLDGERPSLVMCRGYYTRAVLAAWNWRDGKLENIWTFDSDQDGRRYEGQGYHSIHVADVDEDGKDEIIYGACAIDDDGTGLYTTGLGHGDALHLTDIDPARPGLEVWGIHENPRHANGGNLRDAKTGDVLFGLALRDPGRGLAIDVDPRYFGLECWANNSDGLYSATGERIPGPKPNSCNMAIWWDGDLLRELLDGGVGRGNSGRAFIDKWNYLEGRTTRLLDAGADYSCATSNGTKANPALCADILGDWREEVIWRSQDGKSLKIFSTTIPTTHRITTLMHDPVYRLSVAWQNVAYNQPTHPGYYLGAPAPSDE